MTNLNERHWFGVAQAAEYAGVSVCTVRRAIANESLRATQHVKAGKLHIRRTDVDAWLSGEVTA